MQNMTDKTIAVVGLGYVGLPLALLAARKGYTVYGIDVNEAKIGLLQKHTAPYEDARVEADLATTSVEFRSDIHTVAQADIVIICVPTPVDAQRNPDYSPVEKATEAVAQHIKKGALVVLESTVNPGVCDEMVKPILERVSGMMVGVDIGLAHCPERINPGDQAWHVGNIARVVGGFDQASTDRAWNFYQSIVEATIVKMNSLKEAEAVKVVENSFRNVNIAFVNELAQAFDKLGIDVVNVIRGASTKPFAFMAHYPSVGVGGHCIPVDPYYLIDYSKRKSGYRHELLARALEINESMPGYTVGLLEKELEQQGVKLSGATIAVLGLAYKRDVDDTRESPAYEVVHLLKEKGAIVRTYDPYVIRESSVGSIDEALQGAQGVLLVTGHTVFRNLSAQQIKASGVRAFIDGGNVMDKQQFMDAGVAYHGIGR